MISSSPKTETLKWIALIGLFFGCFQLISTKTGPTHNKVVVCYISTWAVYRPSRGSYSIENFDPNLCTHAIYAFAGLDVEKDAIKSLDPWQDLKVDYGKNGFGRLVGLKKQFPHLKVTLAIGGWNEGSKNYSTMAADETKRNRFVKQVTEFILKYNFDGLDLDWEYPTQRGGEPYDKKNFVLLVKELRQEFNKHSLLLTSAIGAAKNIMEVAYDIKSLSKLLDFLHIMCYDYGGSWDKKVGANAPLRNEGVLNVEFTIDYLIRMGADPLKIVMGVPLYGRTFITNLNGYFGDASDEIGFQGPYTRENGFLGYNEICTMLSNKSLGWSNSWDEKSSQAIARYTDVEKGETKVVTYDSTRSIANKMKFAMRKKLAGAMVWSVDTDDFLGDCGPEIDTFQDFKDTPGVQLFIPKRVNANYPLLRTINEGIVLSLDEIEQETKKDNENVIPHHDGPEETEGNSNAPKMFTYTGLIILVILFKFL